MLATNLRRTSYAVARSTFTVTSRYGTYITQVYTYILRGKCESHTVLFIYLIIECTQALYRLNNYTVRVIYSYWDYARVPGGKRRK